MAAKPMTIEELKEEIQVKKDVIEMTKNMHLRAAQEFRKYRGRTDLSEQELTARKTALEEMTQSTATLKDHEDVLADLEEQLRKRQKRDADLNSFVSCTSSKKVELEAEEKITKLRHKFEDEVEELDFQIEAASRKPDSQEKENELINLESQKKRLEKTYERKKRQLEEVASLSKKKLELDDNYQDIDENAGNLDLPTDDDNRGMDNEHFNSSYRPRQEYDANIPPDKDAMILHLMRTQLHVMEKSQSSFGSKKLPDFGGDPSDWGNFKATYDRTNAKYHFDHSENLARIQSALKGKARDAVKHLMANVQNVPRIMEVLEKRFGRPEFVLDFLVEKIKTCKKIDISKPESIVDFGTAVEDLVTNICNFNEEEYLHNKQLVNELVEKLPGAMKGSWFEYLCDDPVRKPNLRFFSKWIARRGEVALRQMKPTVSEARPEERTPTRPKRGYGSSNATEGEEKPARTPRVPCPVCQLKGHAMDSCWTLKKKTLDERWKLVKENKVCFSCLKPGHRTTECQEAAVCGKDGCTRTHHQLLHSNIRKEQNNNNNNKEQVVEQAEGPEASKTENVGNIGLSVAIIQGTDGPLPIVPLRLKGKDGVIVVAHALLDSGATRTLINKKLSQKLKLDGVPVNYKFRTMGSGVVVCNEARKVHFQVSGKYRKARMWPITNAVTVDSVGLSPYSLDVEAAKTKWPYLGGYKGPSLNNVTPELVIGGDHGYLMMHKKLLYKTIAEPVAMRTELGWILQGKLTDTNTTGAGCYVGGVTMDDVLHNLIKESFRLDDFVSRDADSRLPSQEDKRAIKIMEETAKLRPDGRWEIGHLWRDNLPFPSNGYQEALRRLATAERRMIRDPSFAAVYRDKISEYLKKGYIQEVKLTEEMKVNGRLRFISHFGVVNPNKPGKFRLVLDAAEKVGGISLNDKLMTGPDLVRPLQAILWNFRRHAVVICGDIEDMFHRIYIIKEDRIAQLILWRDGDSSQQPRIFVMNVMIFGSTSSPACAIYIKNKNAEMFQEVFPAAVEALITDTYFDDTLSGAKTVDDAICLRQNITEICENGGFVMKKWMSNSQEVMASIPPELRLEGKKQLADGSSETERVLGLLWEPATDEFTFVIKFNKVNPEVLNGKVPTKREACSLIMSIYDPIGIIGNYKIKGMIILQHVWRSGIGWDDDMTADVFELWTTWLADLRKLEEIKLPRCYSKSLDNSEIQLHTMVDASSEAIACICFLRIEKDEKVEVAFIGSNVRVAPLKKKTIPRLELDAAVLGVKLAGKILRELKVNVSSCYYWSDSSTVLSWICSESSRYKEYVANRVGKIQEATNAHDWHWIPTAENVADDATRLQTKADLRSNSRWLRGPEFLLQPIQLWPKKETRDGTVAAATGNGHLGDDLRISSSTDEGRGLRSGKDIQLVLPKVENFSSFYRLIRATAAVQVAAKYWISRVRNTGAASPWTWPKAEEGIQSHISVEECIEAENKLIKFAQQSLGEYKKFRKLSPALDNDGIVRAQGRLGNADCIGVETRHPIILPSKHHVVNLIIDQAHNQYGHCGRNTVFNFLRQKYWIEDGRQAVRRSWTRCYFCKMRRAKPVPPEMGELPSFRVDAYCPPFTYTGVDMFGPIEVTVGRHREKRWGALFTDLVTRGIYLDVAYGLSAEDMMLVLSRFVDCRGLPRHFYSDNGTNFQAVAKEIQNREKYHKTEWHFIPAASPHMGGAWESLVKQTKKVLYNLLHEKNPRDQVFITALKSVENIVNSRPLTYVSGDLDDPEALTPNHFLRGVGIASGEIGSQAVGSSSGYLGEDVTDEKERWGKQWEKAQVLAKGFWERWTREVLPDLLRRNKWTEKRDPVQVGDIVIMVDEQKPRGSWSKAVVTKIFPGKDGTVRVVEVAVRDFVTKTIAYYKRAVAKVCPTGLRCDLSTVPEKVSKSGGRKCYGVRQQK